MTVVDHRIDTDLGLFLGAFRRQRYRSMRQFAEEEIILAAGPFEGRRLSISRQPYMGLWFDAVDSGRWSEFVITGPSQSGKSLCGFVIPLLYYLCEIQETVIAAVPDQDMVRDKWERDIEPIFSRTRYRNLLPSRGPGAKGGRTEMVRLNNGAVLRFMTAGGRDKARAGFTSRVICMTETDGFDQRTSTSHEANKIEQIEARARSYPIAQRRIFKEGTLTTDQGHTWLRYRAGTASRIVMPCVQCHRWVEPSREHLVGWDDCDNDSEALAAGAFCCPSCGVLWSDRDRFDSNRQAKLVHEGQEIDQDGVISGEPKATKALGFRWSAVNNMLIEAGDVAVDEWKARRAIDEDDEERKMCQFVWAIPYSPVGQDAVDLSIEDVVQRHSGFGKGQIPSTCSHVTIGVDVNKFKLHWTAIAWQQDGTGFVIDYGIQELAADKQKFQTAITIGMKLLHSKIGRGWSSANYDRAYVDCRWETDDVIKAIKALGDKRWRPIQGFGQGHWKSRTYQDPARIRKGIVWIGTGAHELVVPKHSAIVAQADANYWKTWLHQRLALPIAGEEPQQRAGTISLYDSMQSREHEEFARHVTAEREVVSFERGKGYVKTWESIRKDNHWLDSTYIACVAGCRCGVGQPRKVTSQAHQVKLGGNVQRNQSTPTFHGIRRKE